MANSSRLGIEGSHCVRRGDSAGIINRGGRDIYIDVNHNRTRDKPHGNHSANVEDEAHLCYDIVSRCSYCYLPDESDRGRPVKVSCTQ